MPRRWPALVLCMLATLPGCFTPDQAEPSGWRKRFHDQAVTPQHALLVIALVDRPIGDDYLNKRLWEHADEMIVERRIALEENGLRVGQLVGTTPPHEFLQLLLNDKACSTPRGRIFPAGTAVPVWVGPTLPHTFFEFVQGTSRTEVNFDQARFGFDVTAHILPDGQTKLTFVPKVENGEPYLPFQAPQGGMTWELRIEKANKKYTELSWEATLGPNEFLIVGCRLDRPRTLGSTAFTQYGSDAGVQRLLVIRNRRAVSGQEAHEKTIAELVAADRAPPLALQATLPASRSNRD